MFKFLRNLIFTVFLLNITIFSVARGETYACDVNLIWIGNGNTYNKKRIIKLINNENSILLEGEILKFQFDKYLQNKQILIGIKNENDKAFSSMSLRLDTMVYKAILSFDGDFEYHYGNCF